MKYVIKAQKQFKRMMQLERYLAIIFLVNSCHAVNMKVSLLRSLQILFNKKIETFDIKIIFRVVSRQSWFLLLFCNSRNLDLVAGLVFDNIKIFAMKTFLKYMVF